jgi:hypothetical protein
MPQLQILYVQHCYATWDEDTPVTGAEGLPLLMVTLPRLQYISICDTTPRRFLLLIPRIDAPPTVQRHPFWRSWAMVPVDRRPVRRRHCLPVHALAKKAGPDRIVIIFDPLPRQSMCTALILNLFLVTCPIKYCSNDCFLSTT